MWAVNVGILCCILLRVSAQCPEASAVGPPQFVHISDPVLGSVYESDPQDTVAAEVYAVGFAHCQSSVRYQGVAVTGDALTYFYVDAVSGEIKRSSSARADPRSAWRDSTWTITVQAYYDITPGPGTVDSITVTITVLQSNTNPIFPATNPTSVTIPDTAEEGTVAHRFLATDDDYGHDGLLEYSLYQNRPDELTQGGQHFSVNRDTGDVYLNRGWNLILGETFDYTLTATDFGDARLTATHQFTITVVDVPAKVPIFLHTERYHFRTPEVVDGGDPISCSSPRIIGNVLAVDGDDLVESGISYSITGSTPSSGASFDVRASGNITICGSPNRESEPEYIVFVQATDNVDPTMTSNVRVYVNITDLNEPPHFLRSHFYGEVSEYSITDTVVVDHLEAVDYDYGINARLSYSIDSGSIVAHDVYNNPISRPDTDFTIEEDTGFIHKNLDLSTLETLRNYYFTVRVTDGGGLTDTTIVYLKIIDINDNEPMFAPISYSASICENVGSQVLLLSYTATDYDLILSGTLDFIVMGPQSDKFETRDFVAVYPQPDSLDAVMNTGNLYAISAFDYEEAATVNLTLIGYDRTPNPLSGTATVTITICDVNDFPPVFEHTSYELSLREDATVPQTILQLRVTDGDAAPHDVSTMSMTGDGAGVLFDVDTAHDADGYFHLRLIGQLDVETQSVCHSLTITATNPSGTVTGCLDAAGECGGSTLTHTATVRICVEDVNEFCPVISPVTYAATINENSPHGSSTGITIQATDGDRFSPNNEITFYIVAGSNDHALHVDPTSGLITVDNPPDFEDQETHTLIVGAYDNGEKGPGYPINDCPSATVTVTITNLNDEPPICVACPYEFSCVQENSALPGDFVGSVSVTDRDLAPATTGFPVSMLTATIEVDDSNGAFALAGGPNTNGRFDISVANSSLLDYETTNRHNLVIEVADGEPAHTIEIHVTINICDDNDQCPMFDASIPHSATVAECPNGNAGGFVTTVIATETDTDQHDTTRYVITSGNDLGKFLIGQQSGEIHISDVGVDADVAPNSYTLTITAMDTGNTACGDTVDITIMVTDCNDNTPTFMIPISYTPRLEGDAVDSVAASFVVTDGDLTSPNNAFTVEIVTGTNGPLMGGVAPFKLVGTDIQFNTDIDREDPGVFRDGSGNAVFYLSLRAVDQGSPPLSSQADLIIRVGDINDNCPRFVPALPAASATGEHYQRVLSEHSPFSTDPTQATQVISLAAFDPDFGANAQLVWTITNDGCAGLLGIDASTGIVFVASSLAGLGTSGHCCNIEVQVDDSVGCGAPPTATIRVCISDINDNCPVIAVDASAVSYPENENPSAPEIVVKTITVTDGDSNPNAELSFTLENPGGVTTDAFPFYLTNTGPATGSLTTELRLRGPTDHEDVSRYDILITATDRVESVDDPGHACQTFTHITVTITDVIDEPPVLTDSHFVGYIFENMPSGTVISLDPGISAHDLDVVLTPAVPPDSVTFSLSSASFSIATTALASNGLYHGVVSTTEMFNYEMRRSYMFEVVATDDGGLTDTGTVTVFVMDTNDNAPTCNRTVLNIGGYNEPDTTYLGVSTCFARVTVCEDAVIDHRILNVAFSDVFYDLDNGNNAEMYFDVQHIHINNNPMDFPQEFEDDFGIRQQDLLVITQELDYESLRPLGLEIYHLIILARDRGSPPMTGTMRVDVEICDSNDNAPEVSSAIVCHCEHNEARMATLTAYDGDFRANAQVDFTIIFVDPVEHRDRFYLQNPVSLVGGTDHMSTVDVYAAATLDREERDYYQIVVEAIDRGTPPLTGTGTVTVRVLDQNDHHPQWIETFPSPCRVTQLPESQPEGYWIQSFSATDMDIGPNAQLTYTITAVETIPAGQGDYSSSFSLGAMDGVLRTTAVPLVYNDLVANGIQQIMVSVAVRDGGPDTLPCIAGGEMECGGFSPGMNTAAVCVIVNNTNTNPPVCTTDGYKCIAEHNDPAAGFLFNLADFNCMDDDGTFPSGFLFTVEQGQVDHSLFQIMTNSQLWLADGVLPTLDRETDDEINVVVGVSDRGYPMGDPLTSFITITICLTDINDNVPQFLNIPDACVRYAENVTGQDVISLQVSDPDLLANGEVQFTLTCVDKFGDTCNDVFAFTREEITGIGVGRTTVMHIRTAQHLDRETVDMYTLTVVARDQGMTCVAPGMTNLLGGCSSQVSICVNVTDINDNRPNVTEHHCICVYEDAAQPAVLLNLTAHDRDLAENAEISFMLVQGLLEIPFDVTTESPGRGTVRLVGSLDFEQQEFYSFLVAVYDRGSQSRRGRVNIYEYINVTVHVVNVPDQIPTIQDTYCNATENRTGEVICTLTATDPDDGFIGCRCPNNNLNFTNYVFTDTIYFVFPDLTIYNNIITIHRDTGSVTVVRKLNRELIDFYDLSWGATNDLVAYTASQINTKTAYAHLFITVLDVNDNAPQFEYPFYIFAIDHDLEYGEEVATVSASDVDLGENSTVRYEFIHSFPHEPYFWINRTTGKIMTAGAFVWQIGNRFDFEVRAYDRDKQPENVVQDNEGWRYTDVPIAFYAAEDQTRVLVTVEEGVDYFTSDPSKQPCARNVLFTVTGHFIYIDRIRHAASDLYYDVTPEDADIVVHAVHPDSQRVLHGTELLALLEADYVHLSNLFAQECGLTLLAVRLIPSVHDQTHIYIGLIVGVCLGVFFIICCCLLCGCICCWERRRRRTYQKRIATLSSLDQFSHSFYATKNPLFVPALGDAVSESLDSGSIVDRENIIYASQELEVPMEEEMLEDDDWLKMEKPPEWLQPVEQEEYDEWIPPPRQPLLPPPPPEPKPESEVEIVTPLLEEVHEEVVPEVQQVVQREVVVQQQEVRQEVVPIAVKRQRQKKKHTVEYEDQETILEVFADVDSEGGESDAELKMTAPPLEAFSDDDEVDLEPDTFGAEAFQSTITSTDFTFDESTSLIPGEK